MSRTYDQALYDVALEWMHERMEEYAKRTDISDRVYNEFMGSAEVLEKWGYNPSLDYKCASWSCEKVAELIEKSDCDFFLTTMGEWLQEALYDLRGIMVLGQLLNMGEHLAETGSVGLNAEELGDSFVRLVDSKAIDLLNDEEKEEEEEEEDEDTEEEEAETDTEGEEEQEEAQKEDPKTEKTSFVLPETIVKGMRNDTLFKFARSLICSGKDKSEVERMVLKANKDRCETPLPEREVKNLVEAASMYEC